MKAGREVDVDVADGVILATIGVGGMVEYGKTVENPG